MNRLSELINYLEQLKNKHGDLEYGLVNYTFVNDTIREYVDINISCKELMCEVINHPDQDGKFLSIYFD